VSAPPTREDAEIHALVKRLARPHPSGGDVVERAALLASGGDFAATLAWISDHAGVAEAATHEPPRRGLHGARVGLADAAGPPTPARFVLPAGALA
jgi:hypothetical protein